MIEVTLKEIYMEDETENEGITSVKFKENHDDVGIYIRETSNKTFEVYDELTDDLDPDDEYAYLFEDELLGEFPSKQEAFEKIMSIINEDAKVIIDTLNKYFITEKIIIKKQ